MLGLALSALGVMMLVAGLVGGWMVREALRNERRQSTLFLLGVAAAACSYGIFTTALLFNGAPWFWAAVTSSIALYLVAFVLQKIGRS